MEELPFLQSCLILRRSWLDPQVDVREAACCCGSKDPEQVRTENHQSSTCFRNFYLLFFFFFPHKNVRVPATPKASDEIRHDLMNYNDFEPPNVGDVAPGEKPPSFSGLLRSSWNDFNFWQLLNERRWWGRMSSRAAKDHLICLKEDPRARAGLQAGRMCWVDQLAFSLSVSLVVCFV